MIYVVACIGMVYHMDSDAAIYMLSFKYSDSHIILSVRRMIWLSLFCFFKLLFCCITYAGCMIENKKLKFK